MPHRALASLDQAIAALTYDEIEEVSTEFGMRQSRSGEEVALFDRSIANDLILIEAALSGRRQTILSAIATSIDEALLAIEEARQLLAREPD